MKFLDLFYRTKANRMMKMLRNNAADIYAGILKLIEPYRDGILLTGAYLVCAGIADFAFYVFLRRMGYALYSHWNVGYRPELPTFNGYFVEYIILIIVVTAYFGLRSSFIFWPELRRFALRLASWALIPLFCVALGVVFSRSTVMQQVFCTLGTLIFVAVLLVDVSHKGRGSRKITTKFMSRPLAAMLAFALTIGSLYMMAEAWYPVQIPNDYYEFTDRVLATDYDPNKVMPKTVDRQEIINCFDAQDLDILSSSTSVRPEQIIQAGILPQVLKYTPTEFSKIIGDAAAVDLKNSKVALPKCDYEFSYADPSFLRLSIMATNLWQAQSGRLFYHHSYVYVPAIHFLKYGFSAPIPYLYGVGNTMFYAMLMKLSSPTLSGYFETFPLAQLTGILAIVLLVIYIGRNVWTVLAALSLITIALGAIGFEATVMAPGFNPLRYLGIVVQLGATVWAIRGNRPWHCLGLLGAFAFSLFWNTEFAMLGVISQSLALTAPSFRLKLWHRLATLAGLVALILVSHCLMRNLNAGFLQTIQSGLFGVGLPGTNAMFFFYVCLLSLFGTLAMTVGAYSWQDKKECVARLCLMPIPSLLLIKFLYNVSYAHLDFSYALIGPLALLYLNWKPAFKIGKIRAFDLSRVAVILNIVFAILACVNASIYVANAHNRTAGLFLPYEKTQWSGLQETFDTNVPADPIEDRMEAIRAEMKPEDRMLFLSPVDHLMSFYINPKNYCGHFELLTNLTTVSNTRKVEDCIRNDSNALVVYDAALQTPCPTPDMGKWYDMKSCYTKKMLELQLKEIMDNLRPHMVLVKKVGDLSFYRNAKGQP